MAWLSPVLWPFLRVLALFTAAPVFSMRAIPVRVRIGLAFFVALCAQAVLPAQPVIDLNGREALGALAIVHRGAAVDRLNRQPTKGDHARTGFLPRHHRQP